MIVDEKTVTSLPVPVLGLSGGFDQFCSCLYGIDKILTVRCANGQAKDRNEECFHGVVGLNWCHHALDSGKKQPPATSCQSGTIPGIET